MTSKIQSNVGKVYSFIIHDEKFVQEYERAFFEYDMRSYDLNHMIKEDNYDPCLTSVKAFIEEKEEKYLKWKMLERRLEEDYVIPKLQEESVFTNTLKYDWRIRFSNYEVTITITGE